MEAVAATRAVHHLLDGTLCWLGPTIDLSRRRIRMLGGLYRGPVNIPNVSLEGIGPSGGKSGWDHGAMGEQGANVCVRLVVCMLTNEQPQA